MLSQLTPEPSLGGGDEMTERPSDAASDTRYGRYTDSSSTSCHWPRSAADDIVVSVCGSDPRGGSSGPSSETRRPVSSMGAGGSPSSTRASRADAASSASSSVGAQPM